MANSNTIFRTIGLNKANDVISKEGNFGTLMSLWKGLSNLVRRVSWREYLISSEACKLWLDKNKVGGDLNYDVRTC